MATYVQGYKMYDREPTPFVPDYKFLSNVLETRQNRYDQNYKAINDAYGRVVYADLSRPENQETRDQFAKQIAPKMAQISGYDLSLRQNADMAKGIFTPFYEDQNVLRDLTNTANYKFGMRYADMLSRSPDKEQRNMYWQEGVDDLNIQMEKYLAAPLDQALNMGIGNYVPNPNLYEYALKLLDEQGFSYETDIPVADKDGNPKWIIRQKNGDLITEQAYAYLNRALMDDPLVQQGYATKARVDAYNFAKAGVERGEFGTIAQGEEFWARDKIDTISTEAALQLGEDKEEAEKLGDAAARWEEYTSKYNFPEDHSSVKIRSDWRQRYNARISGIEDTRNIINMGINADKDLMNKAYMMYMGVNIQDDLAAAAASYSMKDFKRTMEADPYGLKLYDYKLKQALAAQQHKYDTALKQMDAANILLQSQLSGQGSLLLNESNPGNMDINDISRTGKVRNTTNTLKNNNEVKVNYLNNIKSRQVDFVLMHHQFSADDPSNFVIDGTNYSIDEARAFLTKPSNQKKLEKFYQSAAENIGDENAYLEGDLSMNEKTQLDLLRLMPRDIRRDISRIDQLDNLESEIAYNNYQHLLTMNKSYGEELIRMKNEGIPNIFSSEFGADELAQVLSEDQYVEKYIEWARANNRHYDEDEVTLDTSPGVKIYSRRQLEGFDPPQATRTRNRGFSVKNATEEAIKLYDTQTKYISATMNGAIDFHRNERGDEDFESEFRRFSYIEGVEGISLSDMTGASASLMNGYKSTFNPVAFEGTNAFADYKALQQQLQSVGVLAVQFGDPTQEENMSLESSTSAREVLNALASSLENFRLAPRDSNGNRKTTGLGTRPDFTIEYNPIMGGTKDSEKQAGYVLTINDKWFNDYLDAQGISDDANVAKFFEDGDNKISIIIDKRLDANPKSLQNVFNNNPLSDVGADIALSETNNYTYDVHRQTGGYLKVFKDGARFMYEFQGKAFDADTGEFFINQSGKPMFLTDNILELDGLVNNLEFKLDKLAAFNLSQQKIYLESIKNKK